MDQATAPAGESIETGATLHRPLRWGKPGMSIEVPHKGGFVLPTGTVTLLLADIEGSARLWESQAKSMPGSIARHDKLIDDTLGRFGGVRPRDQGEGDSFLAAFSRPSDALACALQLQLTFAEQDWGDAPIKLRIATHTGEVQLRDDDNYIGHTVNRCARLRAIGHGGQTLLSRATYELVADRLPDGATARDLGVHRLKDLARPEHVWQLAHQDLADDFPPLRSLEAMPNNLPVQLTTFIGREVEIEKVCALLETSRLVTLTGAGGVGKTRLALQVGAEILDDHPDGVWLADLGPLTDPAFVTAAVASALSVRESPMVPLAESVRKWLLNRRALVILDNCEHVVGACAELSEALLKNCPGLVVLATSREPLGIEGEVTLRVPSLSLPDPNGREQIEALAQYEAVRLFVDRAVRARPNFTVTNENAPAVAETCHRLEGIPLAIELAAARVRLLTPDQIAEALTDRFHLLTGGARTAMPRQQTLRASVDWSYELLTDEERLLLMRLSVFAGGFSLDAAEGVCGVDAIERPRVLDLLSGLVDKTLVAVDEDGRLARYRLLETIRQYARDRLAESGAETETRDRHLGFYVGLAEKVMIGMAGPDAAAWLDVTERECDNLRVAMEWSVRSSQPVDGLRLVSGVADAWTQRLPPSEVYQWFDIGLATPDLDPPLRAEALLHASFAWFAPGIGPSLAREAIAIAKEIGNERLHAQSLVCLGWQAYFFEPGTARPLLEEGLEISRRVGDTEYTVAALSMLGSVEFAAGRPAAARPLLEEAMAIAREGGHRFMAQSVLTSLGCGLALLGEYEDAKALLGESVALSRELGIPLWQVNPLSWLGLVEIHNGNYEEAMRVLEEALSIARESDIPGSVSFPVGTLGLLDRARGDVDSARRHCEEALEGSRAWGYALGSSTNLVEIGLADLSNGDFAAARAHLDEAEALAREADMPHALALVRHAQARLARNEGDLEYAEHLVDEGMRAAMDAGSRPAGIDILEAAAAIVAVQRRYEDAARLFGAADSARVSIGSVRFASEREAYDADVAMVRDGLGEEDFNAAWTEGRGMSLEEAVAYARRGHGGRKRPSSGWASLTPTELEVTKLVAEGLKNADISERMFISRNTVETHLKHVFSKLGLSSRTELALEATRRADN